MIQMLFPSQDEALANTPAANCSRSFAQWLCRRTGFATFRFVASLGERFLARRSPSDRYRGGRRIGDD
jgi:hypothetical protein